MLKTIGLGTSDLAQFSKDVEANSWPTTQISTFDYKCPNVRFNSRVTRLLKEYASHNTPYMKASALVGVVGI